MLKFQDLPNNVETELALLAGMIFSPATLPETLAIVKPSDFWIARHRKIAEAIADLSARGIEVDLQAVVEYLGRRGHRTQEGTEDLLWDVHKFEFETNPRSITYHAHVVRDYSQRRLLLTAGQQIAESARDGSRPFEEILSECEQALLAISDGHGSEVVIPASESVARSLERLEDRKRGVIPGLMTGIRALDDMSGGMSPAQLTVLAGRPSSGKTGLGLQIALNAAIDLGQPSLFFSIEMSEEEVADRILIQRASMNGTAFRRGHVTEDDEILLGAARDAVESGQLFICDQTVTTPRIASLCRRQRIRTGLSLIVVDYAQIIAAENRKGENRQEEVSRIARDLKAMSKELKVPVLALSQLNRAVESREDHRPRMSDLRESGELENAAHHIWLLFRPEYYDPNDRPGYAELIVGKNRNGPTGSVDLEFIKDQMRFRTWDGPAPETEPSAESDKPVVYDAYGNERENRNDPF